MPPTSDAFLPFPTSNAAFAALSTSSTIEHFVLFKLSSSTDLSKLSFSLGALSSLPAFSHLSAGTILRLRSTGTSELAFIYLLHSGFCANTGKNKKVIVD
ncbi:hypothetical protein FCM35_KLT16667 [Carex littledalei]|uniref:Uncharacterized protein n=1 Tax=Carex littledalei TaxID=544730 RepID=A0A833RHJ3_9POAL|nr:hypothetical protein FCM35_KLT16667 [Carex littledalei]